MPNFAGGSGRASVNLASRQRYGAAIHEMSFTKLKKALKGIGVPVRIGFTTEQVRSLAVKHSQKLASILGLK